MPCQPDRDAAKLSSLVGALVFVLSLQALPAVMSSRTFSYNILFQRANQAVLNNLAGIKKGEHKVRPCIIIIKSKKCYPAMDNPPRLPKTTPVTL